MEPYIKNFGVKNKTSSCTGEFGQIGRVITFCSDQHSPISGKMSHTEGDPSGRTPATEAEGRSQNNQNTPHTTLKVAGCLGRGFPVQSRVTVISWDRGDARTSPHGPSFRCSLRTQTLRPSHPATHEPTQRDALRQKTHWRASRQWHPAKGDSAPRKLRFLWSGVLFQEGILHFLLEVAENVQKPLTHLGELGIIDSILHFPGVGFQMK